MPAPLPRQPTPTPAVFEVGLREVSMLFRGRVVECRGAYLVPAPELLIHSALTGGIDVVAVPTPDPKPEPTPVRTYGSGELDPAVAFAKKPPQFPHGKDSIFHQREARSA